MSSRQGFTTEQYSVERKGGESKNMDIVWVVMKYNKTIGRLHSHHHFYKVCGEEETAIKYTDKLNELDEENHYYYHLEMVR